MARSIPSRVCCALAVIVSPLVGQSTLQVNPAGPYKTIQSAANAAKVGDIVMVPAGVHSGATITQGVSLLGVGTPKLSSNLVVSAVKAGQRVSIKGFSMLGRGPSSLQVLACKGTVHLESVVGAGSSSGPGLLVKNSAHVSAVDCQFDAYGEQVFTAFGNLGPGLIVDSSGLLLVRCSLTGLAFYNATRFAGTYPGIGAKSSRLVLIDVKAVGGGGLCRSWSPIGCLPLGGPQPAVSASAGCTFVIKGSTLTGGKAGGCTCSISAAGLQADPLTTIVRDSATKISVSGGKTTAQPIFDIQARGAVPGTAIPITTRSSIPAPYAVFVNHGISPFGTPPGVWVDPVAPTLLFGDYVSGKRTVSITPPKYLPRGLPLVLQGVVLIKGQLQLTTPCAVVLH